jgi:hypothetical protein
MFPREIIIYTIDSRKCGYERNIMRAEILSRFLTQTGFEDERDVLSERKFNALLMWERLSLSKDSYPFYRSLFRNRNNSIL